MTNPFDVNTVTSSVRLDNKGQGEVSFTVKNNATTPIRGRAMVDADNPDVEKWLSVVGEAERDFAAGSVHQYTMQVKVPPTAPAGNYPIKLKMVGVENPDEIYTYSPTITFEVGKPADKPGSFPWWIIIVAAVVVVLLIVGIVIIVLAGGEKPDVPATQTAVAVNATATAQANSQQQATATAQAQATATVRAGYTFDFIGNASTAGWTAAPPLVNLPFPGSDGDDRGFALIRNNFPLVDGSRPAVSLEMHPRWVPNGTISGCFNNVYSAANPVQNRDQITGRISFLLGASGDVIFRVVVLDGSNREEIFIRQMVATGSEKSHRFNVNLGRYSGKAPTICLQVDAGISSGQDWATWDDLKVVRTSL
jgi:hypothetical protein